MSNPRLKSTREVAASLGVTTRTVARFVERGLLTPAHQLPGPRGAFLFDEDDVAELVDGLEAQKAS